MLWQTKLKDMHRRQKEKGLERDKVQRRDEWQSPTGEREKECWVAIGFAFKEK